MNYSDSGLLSNTDSPSGWESGSGWDAGLSDSIRFGLAGDINDQNHSGRWTGQTVRSPSDADPLPEFIARYRVIRQLGRGGFGLVYLAEDTEVNRLVAVKVPRWDRPLTEENKKRFLNEGKLLAQMDYPAIIKVYDLGIDDGVPYVVMQYVEGENLEAILKSRSLPLTQALDILLQLAKALREAHTKVVVHRDFKPANVIVDKDNQVHLVDFGMALHDDLTLEEFQSRGPIGTPQYMAPEQVHGENHRIDGRTDIWAFGVTMYQVLTGRTPFRARDRKSLTKAICFRNPRPIRQLNARIPVQLERICERCLKKLMVERYDSVPDLIDELEGTVPVVEAMVAQASDSQYLASPSTAIRLGKSSSRFGVTSTWWSRESQFDGNSWSAANLDPLHFVPKGLRCFDEADHGFFTRLLPGPYDRHGIADSIRFWESRLDHDSRVENIPAGVLHGPAGCGKSSYIRAGLLPRIDDHVISVYVDCRGSNLALQIQRKLQDVIETDLEFADAADLTTVLRKYRQSADEDFPTQKVVLILDQFEQWLESCPDFASDPVTEAIRQCDGKKIQTLMVVSDDSWTELSNFFKHLGQRIEDGHNSMSLPLLDENHASKLLTAYGQAVEALPADISKLNQHQQKFIKHAISLVASDGQVLCSNLTILSDLLADRDWGRDSVRQALGNRSITSAFLHRNLDESVRVQQCRWMPTCVDIFAGLLPPSIEDSSRGHELTLQELWSFSSSSKNMDSFQQCLNYLVRDLKLITEIEPVDSGPTAQSRYRLAYDLFLPAIRQWVNRRRSESWKGRIQTRFRQLSMYYEIDESSRYLPGLVEYLQFKACVSRKNLTTSQKQFFRKSTAHRLKRGLQTTSIVTVFVLLSIFVFFRQAAYLDYARLETNTAGEILAMVQRHSDSPAELLRLLDDGKNQGADQWRLRCNLVAALLGDEVGTRLPKILSDIAIARPGEIDLYNALLGQIERNDALDAVGRAAEGADWIARGRLAVLAIGLEDAELLFEILRDHDGPALFGDVFYRWHGDVGNFCQQLESTKAPHLLYGGLTSIYTACHENAGLLDENRPEISSLVEHVFNATDQPGATAIALKISRDFGLPSFAQYQHKPATPENEMLRQIFGELDTLTRFVEIPGQNENGESFYLLNTEVTVQMFKVFFDDLAATDPELYSEISAYLKDHEWWNDESQRSTAMRQIRLSWAIEFVNWMSKKTGRSPAYIRVESNADRVKNRTDVYYELASEASGYRLPDFEDLYRVSSNENGAVGFRWLSHESVRPSSKKSSETFERIGQRYSTFKLPDVPPPVDELNFAVDNKLPDIFGCYEVIGGQSEMCNIDQKTQRTTSKSAQLNRQFAFFSGSYRQPRPTSPPSVAVNVSLNTPFSFRGFRIKHSLSYTERENRP